MTLSTVVTLFSLASTTAGAGVVGPYGIVAPLLTADPAPRFAQAGNASLAGRVPVRLKSVVNGKYQPADQGTVTFARRGQMVHQASVQAGGTVQAEGLEAGSYSVFVHGDDGFAAFSTWVARGSATAETTNEYLSVGLVPRGDLPVVRQILRDHRGVSLQGLPVPSEDAYEVAVRSSGPSRNVAHGAALQISADGTLRGRVVRDPNPEHPTAFQGASVYFVHTNQVVSRAVTDEEGLFQVRGLATGVFSLVVAGNGAFSAMSVEVVPSLPTTAGRQIVNELRLVAFQEDPVIPEISPVFPEDVIVVEEYWLVEDGPMPDDGFPGPGGGGMGGGGSAAGGGGFAGGGGGLGEAIAAGLIAGGIFWIADDDDTRVIISNPNP